MEDDDDDLTDYDSSSRVYMNRDCLVIRKGRQEEREGRIKESSRIEICSRRLGLRVRFHFWHGMFGMWASLICLRVCVCVVVMV